MHHMEYIYPLYTAGALSDSVMSLRKPEAFSKWLLSALGTFGIRREKIPGLAEQIFITSNEWTF